MIPSFPNETSFTATASFTMMMINSELSATNFGEFIIIAPFFSTSDTFSLVLLYTDTSKPKFNRFSATASPNIPTPIIPIFILHSLNFY